MIKYSKSEIANDCYTRAVGEFYTSKTNLSIEARYVELIIERAYELGREHGFKEGIRGYPDE